MKKLFLLIIAIGLILNCSEDSSVNPVEESVVVQAYLYVGEAVNDIRLTTTLPLGTESETAPPINNAKVTLYKQGNAYLLQASAGDSGYYHYNGTDLLVESGDQFSLVVEYNDELITASTVVPEPPYNIVLSSDTLFIPTTFTFGQNPFSDSTMFLEATWDEDFSSLFFVVVENIEENPQEVESDISRFGGDVKRSKFFISAPNNTNEYRINRMSLSHYGQHIIRVYRVNQEYADLYDTRQQDSRDLNEPLTNIENGLGVFSAFNSVTKVFTAIADQ